MNNLPVFILTPSDVTYRSVKDREVVVFDDWLTLHFTDPDQLASLAIVAQEAEASLRQSLGQRRCDSCQRWTSERLVEVHSHLYNDSADICDDCAALSAERVA